MRSFIILALAGLAAAQLQVQVQPHNPQRPPVQIQGPTIVLPPSFDEMQWQEPNALPEWARNNPLWQHEMPQAQPLPEWMQPQQQPQTRPNRPAPDWTQNQPQWNVQPQPQPQPMPEWMQPRPQPQPQPRPEWIMRPQPPQPEPLPQPPRLPIFPQPQPPQWQPRNDWRDGPLDARCPVPDNHTGWPTFLAGPTNNAFIICWGGRAWPFTCPNGSIWQQSVEACSDPGWTGNPNNNNQWGHNWNQWQPIRPFEGEQEEVAEPY